MLNLAKSLILSPWTISHLPFLIVTGKLIINVIVLYRIT